MNVCSAVIGRDFKDWVSAQIEERNAIMAEKKEIMISMDPVMAAKFEASTHFSRKYCLLRDGLLYVFQYRCERYFCKYAQAVQQAEAHAGADQGREGGGCSEGS